MHPYLNTAIKAARNAGDIIIGGYKRLDTVRVANKGLKDFVTNIDNYSEQAIIDVLHNAYPEHGILGEEGGVMEGNEYQWIIDPLDGTTNFVHGLPHFSVSIALRRENRIEHAVIYDPIRQDLFTASRGEGAQRNNTRIRVAQKKELSDCLIGTAFSPKLSQHHDVYFETFKDVAKTCISVRRMGSAALDLAYVASGQLDGFWGAGLAIWDMAAGALLIREAGGLITDIHGKDDFLQQGNLVCGNSGICKQLLKHVKPLAEKL